MGHPGNGIGVLHADLAFEPVRIAEEEAQHGAEVGDEIVAGTSRHQPVANGLEISQTSPPATRSDRDAHART